MRRAGLPGMPNVPTQDVANTFAPSVAARALTMKQALLVASVFELLGAILM